MTSEFLGAVQLNGLRKAGDVLVPGSGPLPKFSALDPTCEVDRILNYTPEYDRKDFIMLMSVFGVLPAFAVRFIIWIIGKNSYFPSFLGAQLRLAEIGLKGIIYSLYYSDARVHKLIHWNASIKTVLSESEHEPTRNPNPSQRPQNVGA